jgi:hypothetical protein
MTTMNLTSLVNYLDQTLGLPITASYIANCKEEISEIDGVKMINADFVKRFFTEIDNDNNGQLLRDIQANVTSYLFL